MKRMISIAVLFVLLLLCGCSSADEKGAGAADVGGEVSSPSESVYDKYAEYRCDEGLFPDLPPEERPILIPPDWEEFFEEFPEIGNQIVGE